MSTCGYFGLNAARLPRCYKPDNKCPDGKECPIREERDGVETDR